MKLRTILNEIGEANAASYPYKLTKLNKTHIEYTFNTESNLTYVVHCNILINALSIEFNTVGNTEYEMTNRNELFKIMATIFKIVTEVVKKHNEIKYIRYDPKAELFKGNNQRDLLYRKYIQKIFPDVQFFVQGGTVFAKIK